MRALWISTTAVVGALAIAPSAFAGTVNILEQPFETPGGDDSFRSLMSFQAGPGERNDLRLSDAAPNAQRLVDAGVPLGVGTSQRPPEACLSESGDTAVCTGSFERIELATLDGDDRVVRANSTFPADLKVDAGDGADDVTAAGEAFGGNGNDTLRAGPIVSDLQGGADDDLILGHVDADTLGGGDGRDRLSGGSGNDRLSGGSGNDRLDTGRGRNLVLGGAGDDSVTARNGRRDRIDCGRGRDSARVDRVDRVRGCERVRRG